MLSSPLIHPASTNFEKTLHAALKAWYALPGDQLEKRLSGYVIDIHRDGLLIEIQTRNFGALKQKLAKLLKEYPVRLVYPIAQRKWIVRQTADGKPISRRVSPKHGSGIDVFNETTHLSGLLPHPNLTIEILFTNQEEIWRDDGQGSWRRKGWSIYDRHLNEVTGRLTLQSLADYWALLPVDLPQSFTNRQLAAALHRRLSLAQKVTYTLRRMDGLEEAGKKGNARLFQKSRGVDFLRSS